VILSWVETSALQNRLSVLLVAGGIAIAPAMLKAHHAFAAEFDGSKPVQLSGLVTKVEWLNPHAHFFLDVRDSRGAATQWELELGSPYELIRRGWNRGSLKQGDRVTVKGYMARDRSHVAAARSITFADGRSVYPPAADGGPER